VVLRFAHDDGVKQATAKAIQRFWLRQNDEQRQRQKQIPALPTPASQDRSPEAPAALRNDKKSQDDGEEQETHRAVAG
jgi:hypothetical protein